MPTKGVFRGLGPIPWAPHHIGGGDPGNDGRHLVGDTASPGAIRFDGGHYASYGFSFSLADSSQLPITGAVWTKDNDTDNYGSALNASGLFTVPPGLAGVYSVNLAVLYPAATYLLILCQITALGLSGISVVGQRVQTTFTASAQQNFTANWTGFLAAGATPTTVVYQASGGARTITGEYSIARLTPA